MRHSSFFILEASVGVIRMREVQAKSEILLTSEDSQKQPVTLKEAMEALAALVGAVQDSGHWLRDTEAFEKAKCLLDRW